MKHTYQRFFVLLLSVIGLSICAYAHAGAMHHHVHAMQTQYSPVDVVVVAVDKAQGWVRIRLTDHHTARPITLDDLQTVHTEKLHALIIDASLEDYSHVHPKPVAAEPGVYQFTWQPKRRTEYRLWLDLTPRRTSQQVYVSTLLLSGTPLSTRITRQPIKSVFLDGYKFDLTLTPSHLRAGQIITGQLAVSNTSGQPVNLQPIMGAYAHIVGFYPDFRSILHVHPSDDVVPGTAGPSVLRFELLPQHRGYIRLFMQVMLKSEMLYVPFDIKVE